MSTGALNMETLAGRRVARVFSDPVGRTILEMLETWENLSSKSLRHLDAPGEAFSDLYFAVDMVAETAEIAATEGAGHEADQ